MIAYLDSSALVKLYTQESGSEETLAFVVRADVRGTGLIARAEVAATFSKAARLKALTRDEARAALEVFRRQWPNLFHVDVNETVVTQADSLAWTYGLRGYDAVHLASALLWQQSIGSPVTLATFDRQLWEAARLVGLEVWPEALE
jgi:predicted nucleic acid-binding protein